MYKGCSTMYNARSTIYNARSTIYKDIVETFLLKPFATLNPTLFGQYSNARIIVDLATSQKPKEDDSAKDTTIDEKK